MEWQPIETAPDDGTVFDAWCTIDEGYTDAPKRIPNCRYVDGDLQYRHSHGWFPFFGSRRKRVVTHWMPLPDAPEAAS